MVESPLQPERARRFLLFRLSPLAERAESLLREYNDIVIDSLRHSRALVSRVFCSAALCNLFRG